MKRNPFVLGSFLSLAALLSGCGGTPSVEEVSREIRHRFPEARFERQEHVRLGRFSMAFVRGLVRLGARDEKEEEGLRIVNAIHSVDVETYKVHALNLDRLTGDTTFEHQLARAGWSTMVRTREGNGDRTWVFTHADSRGSLSNLFVVSLEKDELTLVRVDGRLDQAIAAALAEHPRSALGGGHRSHRSHGSGEKTAAVAAPAGEP
jgi:hypothetical protein